MSYGRKTQYQSFESDRKAKQIAIILFIVSMLFFLLLPQLKANAADNVCTTSDIQEVTEAVADSSGNYTVFVHQPEDTAYLCLKMGTEARIRLGTSDNDWTFSDIVWSHDGHKVAVSTVNQDRTEKYLFIIDIHSTEQSFSVSPVNVTISEQASWSADDRYLAFSGYNPDTSDYDIFVVNTQDVNEVFTVQSSGESDREPAWTGINVNRLRFLSFPSRSYTYVDFP